MNIAVCGVGGVGGYFGSKICQAMEALQAKVYFLARGSHLKAIQSRGLTVRTASEGTVNCRPTLATADVDELPALDACLICVKGFDLDQMIRRLSRKVSETTEIVPLLNGIDIYERIRANLHTGRVYPAAVFVGTHIEEPGVISQDGGACKILYGRALQERAMDSQVIEKRFMKSSIKHEWQMDIYQSIWSKFMFIAAFGLVTACFDNTLGQVMESEKLSRTVRSVMNEVAALATAKGIKLPESIVDDSYRKGSDFPPSTKTSFQRDFEALDRPDERDLFGGTIIRLGKQLDVATSATIELYESINSRKPQTLL